MVNVANVQEMVLPELTDEWVEREHRRVRHGRGVARRRWPSASAPASSTRRATSSSSAPRRRWPGWSTSSRPSRWCRPTCRPACRTPCSSSRRRASRIDQWLQATGQDPADVHRGAARCSRQKAVKVDLALRAVGVAEGLEVTDDDLDAEYARIAVQVRQKAGEVRKAYEKNDAVTDLDRPDAQDQGARLVARARRGRRPRRATRSIASW